MTHDSINWHTGPFFISFQFGTLSTFSYIPNELLVSILNQKSLQSIRLFFLPIEFVAAIFVFRIFPVIFLWPTVRYRPVSRVCCREMWFYWGLDKHACMASMVLEWMAHQCGRISAIAFRLNCHSVSVEVVPILWLLLQYYFACITNDGLHSNTLQQWRAFGVVSVSRTQPRRDYG